jgi:hypothetical protein
MRCESDSRRLSAANDYFEAEFGAFCDTLEREDRRLLRELKLTVREGLMVFEEFEQNTISQGRARLLKILQTIPSILSGFYSRFDLIE